MNNECIVFYSWQSDLPNPVNRGFIQKALETAAKNIRNDDSITIDPVIDRDTSGVPGSPDISHTIFAKIDKAQIFVCDVSIINSNTVDKDDPEIKVRLTPNPNVLVELGYALKRLGPERVILVMNEVFGGPEALPFDLKARRIVRYRADPGSNDRTESKKSLERTFTDALRAILENINQVELEDRAKTLDALRKIRETRLAKIRSAELPISLVGIARLVLQIIPFSVLDSSKTFKVAALGNDQNQIKYYVLMQQAGCNHRVPKQDGFVNCRYHDESRKTAEVYIQFLKNGVIEYIDADLLIHQVNGKPFIPSVLYESILLDILPPVFAVQEELGVNPPIFIALSLLGVRGYSLAVGRELQRAALRRGISSSISEDDLLPAEVVVETFKLDIVQAMRPIFDSIWNAAGWIEDMNYDESGKWIGQPG